MYYRSALSFFLWVCVFSLWSCSSDDDEPGTHRPSKAVAGKPQQYDYQVYIENSGSLNGYLAASGDSCFKSNVYKLIEDIYGLPGKRSLSLYDINTVRILVAQNVNSKQLSDYLSTLTQAALRDRSKAHNGNRSQSDLRNVIRSVLDTTGQNGVTLLITDGIFSPGRNKNALEYLSEQQSGIQGFVIDKLKQQPLSTLVLQFCSNFDGNYYYLDNTAKTGHFRERPYYVFCFGAEEALSRLLQHIREQPAFKGYRHFLFLTNRASYEVKPVIGSYTTCYDYEPDAPMTISGIKKSERDNLFRIKIRINFSSLPVDPEYFEDKAHYSLPSGYTIESIRPYQQNGSTHEFILTAPVLQTGTIFLSLKREMPAWVAQSSLDSDKGLSNDTLEGKTFGLRFLLGGIYDAYGLYLQQPEYFSISIHVKE